jgi:hypothetical protein
MDEGNKSESHHDDQDTVRQQLYAEAAQRTVAHRDTRPPNPRLAQVQMFESSPAVERGSGQSSSFKRQVKAGHKQRDHGKPQKL